MEQLEELRDQLVRLLDWEDGPPEAWDESVAAFRGDHEAMKQIARDLDLFAAVPQGNGQTYLREIVLLADHNAYTLGQLVVLRRLLGIWTQS